MLHTGCQSTPVLSIMQSLTTAQAIFQASWRQHL
jgi:hypothetical protein